MENEKKNENDGRQPRRKGYFITPTTEGNSPTQTPVATHENTGNAAQGEAKPSSKGNGRSRRRRNHPNRSSKPPEDKATPVTQADESSRKKDEKKDGKKDGKRGNAPAPNENGNQERAAVAGNKEGGEGHSRSRRPRKKKHTKKETTNEAVPQNEVKTPSPASTPTASPSLSRQRPRTDLRLKMTLDDETDAVNDPIEEENIDPATLSPSVLESPPSMAVIDESIPRVEVVGIRFKASGKVYYFNPSGKKYVRGGSAIVETARGLEYGDIAMSNTRVKESDVVLPLRPVLRAATDADIARHNENLKKEAEAFRVCTKKIQEHKLDMKLIDAQYTFDNSKLLFYFTSAGRVDFRELVKDLAGVFRTRIELRQIGIRDEAKMMGGLGMCGRPLCCSVFLADFCQVSIKMAKEQNFSLNSSKISGICGRLMCCLRYEHETYEYEIKRTPPVNSVVETPDGNGVVIENSPLAGTVKVRLSVTPEVAPKIYRREDVTVLQKKQSSQGNQNQNSNTNSSQGKSNKK